MSKSKTEETPLSVLIVEDETLVGMGLESRLRKMGHVVSGRAATAAEARALFDETQPDVVLMDIRLGEEDGLELADELMKRRRTPMIILSAFSEKEMIERARDAGVYGYLIKPVTDKALEAQLAVVVQRFSDTEQLRTEKTKLAQDLENRKLLERAKGILMKRANLAEDEAHRRLQAESQKRRIGLPELCKRIIESDELMG